MPQQEAVTVLVPLSDSPASMHALRQAAAFARQRRGKLCVVHVIEVMRALPLNAEMEPEARRGEQLLRRAEEVARAEGMTISGDLLQAREAAQAILDEAQERGADIVVLGLRHQEGSGTILGRTATAILRQATCEVWLIREAVGDGTHPAR
jgi:nucleotide-binding universal stress UspA family protein